MNQELSIDLLTGASTFRPFADPARPFLDELNVFLRTLLAGLFFKKFAGTDVSGWVTVADRMSSPQPLNNPSDEARDAFDRALFERMAEGDQSALGALYDRFSRPLYSIALQVLNDAAEAEDIVHDVFITLWEKAGDYQAIRGKAFSWALTLTRNRAIDRLRSRRRRQELLSGAAPSDLDYNNDQSSDSADDLWLHEKSTEVRKAVATLPIEQRKALELAYFGGLTQQEIAGKLDQPLGTIKARMRRGLFKLRDLLAPRL